MTRREPSWSRGTTFLCLLACLLTVGCMVPAGPPSASEERGEDVIYQVATLSSLLERNFEGTETVGDLRGRGTLGLGTVDQLDGEMAIVDGRAYAIREDGTTDELDSGTGIPFGVVIPFEVDTTLTLSNVGSFGELQSRLDERLSPATPLYAFRVTGDFTTSRPAASPRNSPRTRSLRLLSPIRRGSRSTMSRGPWLASEFQTCSTASTRSDTTPTL